MCEMPEIPLSRKDDIIGLEHEKPELVIFMAGNQFMVMRELLSAFSEEYGVRKIFCETLPPGLMLRQILAGGARFGDRILPGTPDVYTAVSEEAMKTLVSRGYTESYRAYLSNRLAIMVAEGNPKGIRDEIDLGRDDVTVSQPSLENEHIAKYIVEMYREAGGDELVRRIMEEKAKEGKTLFTKVHHRETPERILKGVADAGPVWFTEIRHAKAKGLEVDGVNAKHDQRDKVRYYACVMKKAPNPENARAFEEFLLSRKAARIFEKYGFVPLV